MYAWGILVTLGDALLKLLQLRLNVQFPAKGNLWFVCAIGCNIEPTVEPNHTLPTNHKKHSNGTEIHCTVLVNLYTSVPHKPQKAFEQN